MSGRNTSRVIAVGRYCRASVSAVVPRVGDDAFEAPVARQAEQHPGVVRIVVDDEQDVVALGRRVIAIVHDDLRLRDREDGH